MHYKCLSLASVLTAGFLTAPGLFGSTYYVATNGNDSLALQDATNAATPWLTIQKAATNAVAGDTVIIRGGTYRETVTVKNSGTAGVPITFMGYPGETAVVSGADPVTNWTLESANLYYCPIPISQSLSNGNQVFQNGQMMPEARWPNAGATFPWQNSYTNPSPDWAYVTNAGYTSGTNGWFTCSNLPTRADNYWVGAMLHIVPGEGWVINTPNILASTNGTNLIVTDDRNGSGSYSFTAGNEFYLSGKKGELDSAGEWFYDSTSSNLYFYSGSSPTNVEMKMRTNGFNVSGHPYICISNLGFFACTIKTDGSSTNHVYDGITMKYVMHSSRAATANRLVLQSGDVLRNSEVCFGSETLVYLSGNDIRVINNRMHDAGYMTIGTPLIASTPPTSTGQSYQRNLLSHNTIHNGGRILVGGIGRGGIIQYNDIYSGMKLSSDAGNVYDNNDPGPTLFQYNLVHDAIQPSGQKGAAARGLYLDNQNANWIIHHNIFWGITNNCLCVNARYDFDFVFNNTCASGILTGGWPQDGEAGGAMYNNLFNGAPAVETLTNLLTTDARFNLYTNAGFTNGFSLRSDSIAIDQGVAIPGITDGYLGSAPDLGALEQGGNNWTNQAGWNATPPSPDPAYSYPNLVFANRVVDGSFESGGLSNWSNSPGGNVIVTNVNAWSWTKNTRTGNYGLSFGAGTSQVGQTVTGLVAGTRYKLYVGVRSSNTTATITMGVTNYGDSVREQTVPVTGLWTMNNLSFVTGTNNTSADIYIRVVSTNGTKPVYADDVAVLLKNERVYQTINPMAHYRLDETSGLTAFDASGHGRNATFNGPTTAWTNGTRNGALYFNGSDYLLTPSITTPAELTIACWAKSASATWNANGCLISQRPAFVLHPISGSTTMRWLVYTNATGGVNIDWTPPAGFDITQWHHYAGVFSSSNHLFALVVDGVQVSALSAPTNNPDAGQIYIGKDDGFSRYFAGWIDDLRMYDYALSPPEVQGLMDTNLVLHLALDDPAGSTNAWDSTGLGGNGVLTNMVVASVWTNGIMSGALGFDGVDDAVLTWPMSTPTALTVSCWAKSVTSTWNAYGCLVSQRPSYVLHPYMGTKTMRFGVYTNATSLVYAEWTGPASFDITQWHHYAGVYNPSSQQASLYVDGSLVASVAASSINPDVGQIYVGKDDLNSADRNFNGWIDDVRLYARALAWYEVMDLACLTSKPPYATNFTGGYAYGFARVGSIVYSDIEGWRLQYFGSTANTGDGANAADPDHDGLPNLVEYALGRNPIAADASSVLTATIDANGKLTLSFQRARADVTYIVEGSSDLLAWSTIAINPGTVGAIVTVADNPPTNASSRFLRLKVSSP